MPSVRDIGIVHVLWGELGTFHHGQTLLPSEERNRLAHTALLCGERGKWIWQWSGRTERQVVPSWRIYCCSHFPDWACHGRRHWLHFQTQNPKKEWSSAGNSAIRMSRNACQGLLNEYLNCHCLRARRVGRHSWVRVPEAIVANQERTVMSESSWFPLVTHIVVVRCGDNEGLQICTF